MPFAGTPRDCPPLSAILCRHTATPPLPHGLSMIRCLLVPGNARRHVLARVDSANLPAAEDRGKANRLNHRPARPEQRAKGMACYQATEASDSSRFRLAQQAIKPPAPKHASHQARAVQVPARTRIEPLGLWLDSPTRNMRRRYLTGKNALAPGASGIARPATPPPPRPAPDHRVPPRARRPSSPAPTYSFSPVSATKPNQRSRPDI
jgi:hypothetical protein